MRTTPTAFDACSSIRPAKRLSLTCRICSRSRPSSRTRRHDCKRTVTESGSAQGHVILLYRHYSVAYTKSCSDIKDCSDCLTRKGCGWCESTQGCFTSDVGCIDGLLTDRSRCPLKLGIAHMAKKIESVPEKLRPCNLAANCFACRELPHCLWFTIENKHICVSLSDAGGTGQLRDNERRRF